LRDRRLRMDWEKLRALNNNSDVISIIPANGSLDRYQVAFKCRGLMWLPGALAPSITTNHQCEIYLHLSYPRTPPQLTWQTDIFHPNILSPRQNGGVCIGKWTPAETLDMLCIRIAEMVQMKNFSYEDALNPIAASWVKLNAHRFPIDHRPIVRPEPVIDLS